MLPAIAPIARWKSAILSAGSFFFQLKLGEQLYQPPQVLTDREKGQGSALDPLGPTAPDPIP
ncbi:MAG TPA: hypothetical protein VMI52_11595 [Acetobacteraceae bacterium]|nr:hypothetical protein [Acetobacteraceae bacterium]